MYCTLINVLPSFTEAEHNQILKCLAENYQAAVHPGNNSVTDYINLHTFPNKFEILSQIFKPYNLDDGYIKSMSIQEIRKQLAPHVDYFRKVSLIYNIKGLADTSFYTKGMTPDKVIRMDLHKWYLFDNSSMHSVANVEGDIRVGLVIDLSNVFNSYQEANCYFNITEQ